MKPTTTKGINLQCKEVNIINVSLSFILMIILLAYVQNREQVHNCLSYVKTYET